MIEYKRGNLFNESVEALVNPVNCVGVMGRGLALQFKMKFPENFNDYAIVCTEGKLKPGEIFIYETREETNPKYIINFSTKNHWRAKSKIEYIDNGLEELIKLVKGKSIKSIAIPPLVCGLGGLNWCDVKSKIVSAFETLPEIKVVVFEPLDE